MQETEKTISVLGARVFNLKKHFIGNIEIQKVKSINYNKIF